MVPGMTDTKSEWRRRLLAARRSLDEATRRRASAAVAVRVVGLPAFRSHPTLLTHRPMGAEVDPGGITERALEAAKRVYYVAEAGAAPAWHAASGTACAHAGGPHATEFPLLVVVPGVAFDVVGRRLGRGAGFYDRALAALRAAGSVYVVGLAYDVQIVSALPHDAWDEPVDAVVTESRLLSRTEVRPGCRESSPR